MSDRDYSRLSVLQWLGKTLNAGVVTAIIGALALWSSRAWLIPSLGPSILMQCYMPHSRESRVYSVVVGQWSGMAAGIVAVAVAGSAGGPSELAAGALRPDQVIAAVLALTLTLLLQIPLRAVHPPAASTALLWAIGSVPFSLHAVVTVAGAIGLVGLIGEPVRRWEARRIPPRPS